MTKKEKQLKVYKYLLIHPCGKCNENNVVCLDFHHRDPQTKFKCISTLLRENAEWHIIEEEIKKCDVLCKNCHAKITAYERNWLKSNDEEYYEENTFEDSNYFE